MKILLIDDHALFRDGMKSLLTGISDNLDIAEAGDCDEALRHIKQTRFDIVLLDLNLPGRNGLDALLTVKDAAAETPVAVLSGETSGTIIRAAFDNFAMAFIPKSYSFKVMKAALELVLKGGTYVPPLALTEEDTIPVTQGLDDGSTKAAFRKLTKRKLEVLQGAIAGNSNKVIARDLGISHHTVKLHLAEIYQALQVNNRTQAAMVASRLDLKIMF